MERETDMKEAMIMNCVSVAAGALAIAVACKITKSAWPLLAFYKKPIDEIFVESTQEVDVVTPKGKEIW